MKSSCKSSCIIFNHVYNLRWYRLSWIYWNTVSWVDTGSLNMLHDTRNKNILTIAYSINFDFLTHKVLINKDWVILLNSVDDVHEFNYIFIRYSNLHTLSTKYIWRSYKHRISKLIGSLKSFINCKYSLSLSSWNLCLLKNLIKKLSILSSIYIFCLSSKNRNSHLHKCFCKLDSCLSTKLYNCTVRLLKIYNWFNIFCCKWFKVKLISNIKVSRNCLWVIIYNNCLETFFFECPCTMNWTEVELDTLSDSDWTRTKYKNLLLILSLYSFVLTAIYWIIVWCCSCELCSTCINHLKCCMYIILVS